MPDVDGGHYFLTVLVPVRTDPIVDKAAGWTYSHPAQLAQKLALIRTGKQTAASPPTAEPSPFSRNTLNHFARFTLIDGPNFNGKVSQDALVATARGTDPLTTGPVDSFDHPYLLFAADFDAQKGDADTALRDYTDALWTTMQKDLNDIFGHCVGFEKVTAAAGFNAYIRQCQVETTMPFNDYWAHDELRAAPNPKGHGSGLMRLALLAVRAVVAALAIWLVALFFDVVLAAIGHKGRWSTMAEWVVTRFGAALLVIAVVVAVAAAIAYFWLIARAKKPFPTAPNSDLPSVLKALYVQQHFTDMLIEAQGMDDAALRARFGSFLAAVVPEDVAKPTQPPGEFRAPSLGASQ